MAGCLILEKALLEETGPWDKLVKLDVKETKLNCNIFSRGRVDVRYLQVVAQVMMDEDTASRLWLQQQQNNRVLRLLSQHKQYHATPNNSLIQSTSIPEHLKMEMEIPCSNKIKFITACSFSNDSFEDIMKAQVSVIKASATLNIQAFKIKKSVSISFRMTQVHKMAKDHMMMIKDYDWMMISKKLKDHIQVKLKPKSLKFTASDSQDTDQ
ncbi:hypothetical protein Tco_1209278 [Tanacetum coccineum]